MRDNGAFDWQEEERARAYWLGRDHSTFLATYHYRRAWGKVCFMAFLGGMVVGIALAYLMGLVP